MNKEQKTQPETQTPHTSPKFHINEVLAKFSPQLTRSEQAKLITEEVISTLSDPNWFIRENFHEQQWKMIFPYILQSYCRRFFLMNTGLSDVVLEISTIKFSCLKQLDLSSNKINNIEALCFLRIPNIKNIILRNNFIVNISPLKKGKWKNLELLDLECNLFVEWGRINQIYIDPHSIQYFSIEFYNPQTIINLEDISRLYAKFQWNKQTTPITEKLSFFKKETSELLQRKPNHLIIPLGQKKYQALQRKFSQKT